ncbi:Zn-ribbon domain-containing OB-fold protein [Arthrobacter ginsengisoli]|uniref:Zn-ribbon domain-containing OB-fold protein n=1 Tax=Arthrobacter ginsengisoli TaxID=1356565 RepID=UPI00286CEA16|nr:Zn-ribbon domain-containing OB-fold protein [Arthrobacter ginsengisoli]
MTEKTSPEPTPDTQPFFDATARGELRLPKCRTCGELFFYPRSWCPKCSSEDLEWVLCSGRARLHSYLINTRPAPGFEEESPYSIAIVELEEGPRMMTNIVGVPQTPEHLVLDMPLEVVFDKHGDVAVPKFAPAGEAA